MENRRKEKKRPWAPSKHQMVESISFCSRLSRGRFSSPFLDALSEGASRSPCATEKGAREERRRGSRARGNKSELKEGEKNGKKKKKTLALKTFRPRQKKCLFSFLPPNSIPDTAAACSSEWKIVKQTWARRQDLPLAEAGLYTAFVGEMFAWFCVGEVVGRGGSISGYSV